MKLSGINPEAENIGLMYDHADEDYIFDGDRWLIRCSGHYSMGELEQKVRLLQEAIEVINKNKGEHHEQE